MTGGREGGKSVEMKRLLIFAVLAAGTFLAIRRVAKGAGPALRERCAAACERMLANMPESFPPNRMMADLEVLKEQTARVLDLVERQAEGQA